MNEIDWSKVPLKQWGQRRLIAEVEHLRRMNEAHRGVHDRLLADPGDVPFVACDNSCACVAATGMATNGGCRCDERRLRAAVRYWRRRAQFLQTTIQIMRGDEMPSEANPPEIPDSSQVKP